MTVSTAQGAANTLREILHGYGVKTSLELQPGVGPKNDAWGVAPFVRGLGHHIASRPSQGMNPGLGIVKKGRSDLQGPLCNAYGGYDRIARIITFGWANHPGKGGPWSVPGWGTVPVNNGRPYIFGWEFEGGYEPYTDEMHDFMARCGAATLDWLGEINGRPAPLECWDEHKGWAPARKVDRIGYTTASGRARIAAVRGGGSAGSIPGGFLMSLSSDEQRRVLATADKLAYFLDQMKANTDYIPAMANAVSEVHWGVLNEEQGLRVAVSGLYAKLAEAGASGITAADIAALIPAGMAREVADELDRRARDGDPATGPLS